MRIHGMALVFFACPALATDCAPIRYSASEVAAWEVVLAGRVAEARTLVGAGAVLAPEQERVVRVAVDHAFRGDAGDYVAATAYPCDSERPAIGERVVVYGNVSGALYTAPANELEAGLRELFSEPEGD